MLQWTAVLVIIISQCALSAARTGFAKDENEELVEFPPILLRTFDSSVPVGHLRPLGQFLWHSYCFASTSLLCQLHSLITIANDYTAKQSYSLLLVFHHSFIPGLKPSCSANPSHRSLSFSSSGLTTWISPTFTVTAEHIRFYFFSVLSLHFLVVVSVW